MSSAAVWKKVLAGAAALGVIGAGAAVAVTSAANVQETIDGCRLVDTRAATQVGPRVGPIGPGETMTIQATGDNGNCVDLPDAASIQIHLTSRDATEDTFFTAFNADLPTPPVISHLNPRADVSTSSNTTTVTLSAGGAFKLYNNAGEVEVIIDVLGLFAPDPTYPPPGPAYRVTQGAAPFVGDTVGMRLQQTDEGQVLVGVNDLDDGNNRNTAVFSYVGGSWPFTFTFDGATLTTRVPGAADDWYPFVPEVFVQYGADGCPTPDLLQLELKAAGQTPDAIAASQFDQLIVNGVPFGTLGPAQPAAIDGPFPGTQLYTITGDLSTFDIEGLFRADNWGLTSSLRGSIELTVGCSS